MRENGTALATEKKRRAGFNSADLMIFLLCVLCIAGMVLRFIVIDKIENDAAAQSVTVTLLIEGVSETSREYLGAPVELYLEDGTTPLGTVTGMTATASPVYVQEDDGTITVMNSVNGKVDIKLELTAKGVVTESGFLLGGTKYIAPNMTLPVKTPMLSVSALIMDISVGE